MQLRRIGLTTWLGSTVGRAALVATGGVLFVFGLLTFVLFQTQLLFTELAQVEGIQSGLVPRNDAGILIGAMIFGGGLTLMLFALSPRPVRSRLMPAGLFAGSVAFLLALHFTVFVNAFLLPSARIGEIGASFLFHDTSTAIPIAVFLLALFTVALIGAAMLAGLALIAPDVWENHVLHPQNVDAHRTRIVLTGLLVLGTGAAFARQFFVYALTGDRFPPGGLVDLNVTVVYYLLGFALVLALFAFAARTALLAWGDLRVSPSYNFRRSYRSVTHIEAVLWSGILLLNAILLLAGPTFQPDARTDRVFAVNSKGVSIFFHLVAGLYLAHRWMSHRYLVYLRRRSSSPTAKTGWDLLASLSVSVVAAWSLLALLLWPTDLTPLTQLTIKVLAVATVLLLFALRSGGSPFRKPTPRIPGAAYLLIAAVALYTLAGIMLWGIGNSITTRYAESSGFITTSPGHLLWARWLGAAFLAIPVVLALRTLVTRRHDRVHPAPLLVVGLSILLGLNLLLAITPTVLHPEAGRTDVVVGFNHVRLSGADGAALLAIGAATAALGSVAAILLVQKGARGHRDPTQSTVSRSPPGPDAPEADARRRARPVPP